MRLLFAPFILIIFLLAHYAGVDSASPTIFPTKRAPTYKPSKSSPVPTESPSATPSQTPPTVSPSRNPTLSSRKPTPLPSRSPSVRPTFLPTSRPTLRDGGVYFSIVISNVSNPNLIIELTPTPTSLAPTSDPSLAPTRSPSGLPTTGMPTTQRPTSTFRPTFRPTLLPTSLRPTIRPTTLIPTFHPTFFPSSSTPSIHPTGSFYPTKSPRKKNRVDGEFAPTRSPRRARSRRELIAVDIPSSKLPSPFLDARIDWVTIYEGVHCLVDFLIQAGGGIAATGYYLGATQKPSCNGTLKSCFPATFNFLILPQGSVIAPSNTSCDTPQCPNCVARCPTCDDACVISANFDNRVRPLMNQQRLLLLGAISILGNFSETRNLVPNVDAHVLSSTRFCREDFLDPVERARIFSEAPTIVPTTASLGPTVPTVPPLTPSAFSPVPTINPSDVTPTPIPIPGVDTTAIILGVVLGLVGLAALCLLKRSRDKKKKKQRILQNTDREKLLGSTTGRPSMIGMDGGGGGSSMLMQGTLNSSNSTTINGGVPNTNNNNGEYLLDEQYSIDVSKLRLGQEIGAGSSGTVYAGRYMGSDVCVKEIPLRGDIIRVLKQEFDTLKRLQSPHVIQLFGFGVVGRTIDDLPRFVLVMELMDTSLDKLIVKKRQLSSFVPKKELLEWALDIATQIALGLAYIHSKDIIHCDVKTHNILVDKGGKAKLCDLGIAKNLKDKNRSMNQEGTISYMSPELLRWNKVSKAVDVYAYAIVLWQLYHLQSPHPEFLRHQDIIEQVCEHNYRPEIDYPALNPKITSLMERSWDSDPDNRPTFVEIVDELEDINSSGFTTTFLENILSVGDSVFVFTKESGDKGLLRGVIRDKVPKPNGGFVYNLKLQDESMVYSVLSADLILQQPSLQAADPQPVHILSTTTLGDAMTIVMEHGLEKRKVKQSKWPLFHSNHLNSSSTSSSTVKKSQSRMAASSGSTISKRPSENNLVVDVPPTAKQNTDELLRMKSYFSAPPAKNAYSPSMMRTPPAPAMNLELSLKSIPPPSNLEQTFAFDGNSFEFSTGLKLHEDGLSGSHLLSHYDDQKIIRVARLGQGEAGKVSSGIHEETMEIVAIKEVTKFFDRDVRHQAKRELEALLELRHECIVGLRSVYFNPSNSSISFILEYVLGGSLQDLIKLTGKLANELSLKRIARDVCSALAYCHGMSIAHLDVKPANILLTLEGRAKLADFGLAKIFKDERNQMANTFIGSSMYMSPERLQGQPYSFAADIFGMGISLAEACLGKHPMSEGNKLLNFLMEYQSAHPNFVRLPTELSPPAQGFIMDCLATEPEKRPTASQLLLYKFVVDADESMQQAMPEKQSHTATLLLKEFLECFAQRFRVNHALDKRVPVLSPAQLGNLVHKFQLSEQQVIAVWEDAFRMTGTTTSEDTVSSSRPRQPSEMQIMST